MNKEYLDDGIFVVKNFVSKEDIEIILKDFRDINNWEKRGVFYQKEHENYSDETNVLLNEKYRNLVESLINDDKNMVNWQRVLQKYVSDKNSEWAINPHADRFDYKETNSGESTSAYVTKGYIMYFNDDYIGGEVVYINKGIILKPEPGMLVVHSGYEEYSHGVKAVTSGERYMITGFVYEKDFYLRKTFSDITN